MARADRREQLVEPAEQVFVELGFGNASVEDVADSAGVTKPVIYDHFGSKDGLLAAVVARLGDQMLEQTTAAAGSVDAPEDALREGLVSYFRFVDRYAGAWSLLLREVAPGTLASAEADRVRAAQVDMIAALVSLHLPAHDAERAFVYAHVVSGASERLAAVRLTGKKVSAQRAATLLMDVLWTGFAQLQAQAQAEREQSA
ncbi:MAG: regulatory protein TetR [Frankiales bacterium]|nr:regulatory protein TetR [Frankiales bacterium]